MQAIRERVLDVWRRSVELTWPLSIEQLFNTLMRTTDVLVTGLFSPAAVAAVGLADLYAQLPMRFGHGLGAGAIALSSQETGRETAGDRDEAVTQALGLGLVVGFPLLVFGSLFGHEAIAVLGAAPEVVGLGGSYLTIVLIASPAYVVGLVGARALQGTGDTRTPMYVNITANVINIVGSVVLGLGLGPAPRLEIIGVGLATAVAHGFTAVAMVGLVASARTAPGFARPRNPIIARQLLQVSVPEAGTGLVTTAVYFPFNALLVGFGTEAVAAYHIGNRMYHQIGGPLYRAYSTTASILVGQHLGADDPDAAGFETWALLGLALATLGVAGAGLFVGARPLVRLFTADPQTVTYAAGFARTFGAIMPFVALFFVFSGAFRGAGDTRTPFFARLTGLVGFFLGGSYVAGVTFGQGVVGVYVGIGLAYVWMGVFLAIQFLRGGWVDVAASMLAERDTA